VSAQAIAQQEKYEDDDYEGEEGIPEGEEPPEIEATA
jgi:hypothetical protein